MTPHSLKMVTLIDPALSVGSWVILTFDTEGSITSAVRTSDIPSAPFGWILTSPTGIGSQWASRPE